MRSFFEKLFDAADRYCKQSDWKDMALLKICLFSIGLIAGWTLPKKKSALGMAAAVFAATYCLLMSKFIRIYRQ